MLAVVVRFGGTIGRQSPHVGTPYPGLGIGIPGLPSHTVSRSGQHISVWKDGKSVLVALLGHDPAIRIMPLRLYMDVVPPRVVGDMNDAMIESDEQVPCRGPAMSEHHAPRRCFFPAIDRRVAEKFISPDRDGSIHVQRHFVGLSQMKSGIAEIGKRLATARRG